MLQKINARVQGVFAWIIIFLVMTTFAMFGVEYYMQSRHAAAVKALVNGNAISVSDFDLYAQRMQRQKGDFDTAPSALVQQKMLNELILTNLETQAARAVGFSVSPAQSIAAIQNIQQFQVNGHFSNERYHQGLRSALFTPNTFQKEISQSILLNQQRFSLGATEFALPDEVNQFVKLYMQTRDYDYLVIPSHQYVNKIKVKPEAIQEYYQQHHQSFTTPEKVSVDYIRLSMRDIRETTTVSEEQLKNYYHENKSNYTTPPQWQVAQILLALPVGATPAENKAVKQKSDEIYAELIASPEKFLHFVKTRSDDKISVIDSGVLPWISAGQTEYDKVLVDLTKVGQFSKPVKTSQGYEIFKLMAYRPLTLKSFDAVKQSIREQLLLELVQTQYSQTLDQISDLAYQSPDTLSTVSEALHLKIDSTPLFTRDGGDTDLTKNPRVLHAAFSHDVLEGGNNSEPLQIDNETVVVLRVAKHVPASETSFSEMRGTLETMLVNQQAAAEAKHVGDSFIALKNKPVDQTALLNQHHLKWTVLTKISMKDKAAPKFVNQFAFHQARMGEIVGKALKNGDFVLVRLNALNDGQLTKLTQEQKLSLSQKLETVYGALDFSLYTNALLKNAKIVLNP